MHDPKNEPLVIIKNRRRHAAVHHGGAWKVAYADFVTAMMSLFIVLWLTSASDSVRRSVARYFNDPKGTSTFEGTNLQGTGHAVPLDRNNIQRLKEQLVAAAQQMPNFDRLKNQVEITAEQDGLRIELLEQPGGIFFELGSAQPTPALRGFLRAISPELGRLGNRISIEGHTDSVPYNNGTYTNWELSADRANAARRLMQSSGVLPLVSASTGSSADFGVTYGASAAATWSSASLSSAAAPLSPSSFQLNDGTNSATIDVQEGDTFSTIATKINASGEALSASVITDSSGAHLQVTSSGSASVSISSDPAFSLTRASTAANASLTIDGIPIRSASNTVTGTVAGLALDLAGTTPANNPATLTVAADTTQITQALSTFVSDYNAALSQVNSQFTYTTSSGSQGVLSSDSTVRSLQSALEGIPSYLSAGGPGSNSIQSLSDLGITVNDDGSLSLTSAQLNAALSNPAAVQNFFQGASLNGFAQQFSSSIDQFNNPANGSITYEIKNLNQQYSSLQSQISNYESGYIASQQTVLTAMYSQAEIALQQLPAEMQQIQAQLGNNTNSNG